MGGILNGSNDYEALARLYGALGQPQNRSQELFVRAWELTGFIASDGFEWVFQQRHGVQELAAMLANVGFEEGAAFIRKAYSMVPETLFAAGREKQLFEHLRSNFGPFDALLDEYLRVADNLLLPALGSFIRQNQQDFEGLFR
jgi:hypothetical protein